MCLSPRPTRGRRSRQSRRVSAVRTASCRSSTAGSRMRCTCSPTTTASDGRSTASCSVGTSKTDTSAVTSPFANPKPSTSPAPRFSCCPAGSSIGWECRSTRGTRCSSTTSISRGGCERPAGAPTWCLRSRSSTSAASHQRSSVRRRTTSCISAGCSPIFGNTIPCSIRSYVLLGPFDGFDFPIDRKRPRGRPLAPEQSSLTQDLDVLTAIRSTG